MGTRKLLEEALAQIDLLEKKLSESREKESDLLKSKIESQKKTDLLNRIIDHNPYSIQILDADGYHIRENKAFLKLFKTVPDEKWSILNDPQIKESGLGGLLLRVLDGDLVYMPPVWYNVHLVDSKYPDNLICIGSVIFPVFLSDGKLEFIVLMHEDITKRKLAEKELIEAKNKAEEGDRLKSAFLANMSHEFRTPINGIIGFSELLTDPEFEQEQKDEFVQHIIKSGNNLLAIISDIMDISKMESGEITIRNSQINAQEFMSGIKEQYAFYAETKKLELKLIFPDADDKTVFVADAERLRQIFNNLISNAFKFTTKGSVEIGYQPKGKMVEFFVRDTGIGIPAVYHDKIFERFRQVETGSTRTYGGNGLGLAISKNLVELMGGKIWLESEPGNGSVFYFTLPT